jgi:hypothetical protein
MEFEYAITVRDIARKNADKYSDILNSFAKSSNGLVSDDIRLSEDYVKAKKAFNLYFNEERNMNQYLNKMFRKELKKLRDEKRALMFKK